MDTTYLLHLIWPLLSMSSAMSHSTTVFIICSLFIRLAPLQLRMLQRPVPSQIPGIISFIRKRNGVMRTSLPLSSSRFQSLSNAPALALSHSTSFRPSPSPRTPSYDWLLQPSISPPSPTSSQSPPPASMSPILSFPPSPPSCEAPTCSHTPKRITATSWKFCRARSQIAG
jgi:hypothetical protein